MNPTIAQDHKFEGIVGVRACFMQQQLLDVARQVFDEAKTGTATSFRRLLRQRKTGAAAINFPYR